MPTSAKIRTFLHSLEAHGTRQLFVRHRAHNPGDIVQHHESQKRIQKPITSSKEIAKPSAHSHKYRLNHIPKLFHHKSLLRIKIGGSHIGISALTTPIHLSKTYVTVCSVSVYVIFIVLSAFFTTAWLRLQIVARYGVSSQVYLY